MIEIFEVVFVLPFKYRRKGRFHSKTPASGIFMNEKQMFIFLTLLEKWLPFKINMHNHDFCTPLLNLNVYQVSTFLFGVGKNVITFATPLILHRPTLWWWRSYKISRYRFIRTIPLYVDTVLHYLKCEFQQTYSGFASNHGNHP